MISATNDADHKAFVTQEVGRSGASTAAASSTRGAKVVTLGSKVAKDLFGPQAAAWARPSPSTARSSRSSASWPSRAGRSAPTPT